MFSEYWRIHGQSISNISYLSNFATIFVDQMLFINEYEEVCVAIKKVMEFSDDALERLNLNENEQVIKARDSIEDVLKQAGLLKEDEEEEEF